MRRRKLFGWTVLVMILMVPCQSFCQEILSNKLFIYWGWNRAWYTNSDIHFQGTNYDFTLDKVVATDAPTSIGLDPYLNPLRLTIPQTNFRLSYFLSEKYSLSFGFDHMKYVVLANQSTRINGYINEINSIHNGDFLENEIILTPDFLQYEHTDGLNYIFLEFARFHHILNIPKARLNLRVSEGVAAGVVFPRSAVTFLDIERSNDFGVAGYGTSLKVGLNLGIGKHFHLLGEYKGGFINMPNVRISQNPSDQAQQRFFFGELVFQFGFDLPLSLLHSTSDI